MDEPGKVPVRGKQFRIIPTKYPPIAMFEKHVPARLLPALYDLEARTNPRLQQEVGNINLVDVEDIITGHNASIVMAAFTHIGYPSRFTDGSYGVYYAARDRNTAITETVHHRSIIARDAGLSATSFDMRVWIGTVKKHLHDIRGVAYRALHDKNPRPEDHPKAQKFGFDMRTAGSWGLLYRSVRNPAGECIVALKPPTVSRPTQGAHLVYEWDGDKIIEVYERSSPIMQF